MTSLARDMRDEEPAARVILAPVAGDHRPEPAGQTIARIPNVTIHAFCEAPAAAEALQLAALDRRMSRATLTVQEGGIRAAIKSYRRAPTPNMIILQSGAGPGALLSDLDDLALVCDADTKVLVIGEWNDIAFYRELLKREVSEYLRAPVDPLSVLAAISSVFSEPGAGKLGRVYAFVGARGGVGSSTIAHNVAWMLGRHSGTDVILADLDLHFGTAGLNFDLETGGGVAEALQSAERLDDQMLERLLIQCDEHLHLLATPALLDTACDLHADSFDPVIELARASVSHVVLDVPHVWAAWSRNALLAADEVVITATPDLASLRNTKHLVEMLEQARPHDSAPRLVLNQLGMPERPEIGSADFAEAAGLEPLLALPFDAKAFGTAANQGRMVAETARRKKSVAAFRKLAEAVSGRPLRKQGFLSGLACKLGRKSSSGGAE